MSDWQPGDLALCVRGGDLDPEYAWPTVDRFPEAGRVYLVHGVVMENFSTVGHSMGLILPDAPPNVRGNHVWCAGRFVKVTPGAEIEGKEVEAKRPVEVDA